DVLLVDHLRSLLAQGQAAVPQPLPDAGLHHGCGSLGITELLLAHLIRERFAPLIVKDLLDDRAAAVVKPAGILEQIVEQGGGFDQVNVVWHGKRLPIALGSVAGPSHQERAGKSRLRKWCSYLYHSLG